MKGRFPEMLPTKIPDAATRDLSKACVKKLIDNARVGRYLTANCSDIFAEFEKLAVAGGH